MKILRAPFVALGLAFVALPAAAGGVPFDLPRLDFPAPDAGTSRDCTLPLLPQAPHPCDPAGN